MAKQSWTADVDRLFEAVNNIQRCLECRICLDLMTVPQKTRCGHSFCQLCIKKVLSKRNAHCPLCNKSLQRRSISRDDHLEMCIQKFHKLVNAINTDSNINILSRPKLPRDTRESCSNSSSSRSSYITRKPSEEQSTRTSNIDGASSANQRTTKSNCDNARNDPPRALGEKSVVTKPSGVQPSRADENDDAGATSAKVCTWLHCIPDELVLNSGYVKDEPLHRDKVASTDVHQSGDDSKSGMIDDDDGKTDRSGKAETRMREGNTADYPRELRLERAVVDDAWQESDGAGRSERAGKKTDPGTGGLRYNASHARIRANAARDRAKSEETGGSGDERAGNRKSRDTSSSVATSDRQFAPVDTSVCSNSTAMDASKEESKRLQTSTNVNWSRVIEVGREMRARKRKVKRLNVSTERNKRSLQIVEDIMLTPRRKYDLTKSAMSDGSAGVSDLPRESDADRKRDAIDKSLDSTSAEVTPPRSSTICETRTRGRREESELLTERAADRSTRGSYITPEEGKQMRVRHPDSRRTNEIVGSPARAFERTNVSDDNRHLEGDVVECDSPSRAKKLIVLTPERLNRSAMQRGEAIRDTERTPVNERASTSRMPAEIRTPGARASDDSAQKMPGEIAAQSQFSTPNKNRLSLKRNVSTAKSPESSPLSSQMPLAQRRSADKQDARESVKRTSDRKSVDPPSLKRDSPFDRLANVRRDLSPQIAGGDRSRADRSAVAAGAKETTIEGKSGDVAGIVRVQGARPAVGSAPSKEPGTRTRESPRCRGSAVKFMQLGTLIKRREVKYFCSGATKRERALPAEVRVGSVYNMQQSTSRSEVERHVANKSRDSLTTTFPAHLSNDSHDSDNQVTVIEKVRSPSNPNSERVASEDANLTATLPAVKVVPACSTWPSEDTDGRPSREKLATAERPTISTSGQSSRSIRDGEKSAQSLRERTPEGGASENATSIKSSHVRPRNEIKLLSPEKDSQLKFLTIDSPSQRDVMPVLASSTRRQSELAKFAGEENNFSERKDLRVATIATAARALSSESCEFVPQFQTDRRRKRKRTRAANDKELFESGPYVSRNESDDSKSSVSDSSRRTIKLCKFNRRRATGDFAKSGSDSNRKRRLSSSSDQDTDVARLDSARANARKKRFKRIMSIHGSDTESEHQSASKWKRSKTDEQCDRRNASITSTLESKHTTKRDADEDLRMRSIVEKWSREYNATRKDSIEQEGDTSDGVKSVKCSSEGKAAAGRRSSIAAADRPAATEMRENSESSQSSVMELNSSDNNSVFELLNEIVRPIRADKSRPSQKSVDFFDDDFPTQVLRRSRNDNIDAPRSTGSASRNDRTTSQQQQQRDKDNREYLLQDNFDEIIANVELPQSEDMMLNSVQPDRNLDRTLTQQSVANCPAVTNEPRIGVATRETAAIPASSSSDIFAQCSYPGRRNDVEKSSRIDARESDMRDVSCGEERDDKEDERDEENVTVRNDATANKDSRGKITPKCNTSREKERPFDRTDSSERLRIDKEINVSTKREPRADDGGEAARRETAASNKSSAQDTFEYDSLMNITQQQARLKMFEEDLFGVTADRNQEETRTTTSRDGPFQAGQATPKRKKRPAHGDDAAEEHLAEEDDVVEKTPETKMRNNGNNVKPAASNTRRNIAMSYLSPIPKLIEAPQPSSASPRKKARLNTPVSSRSGIYPLYQSTPKSNVAPSSASSNNRPEVSAERVRFEQRSGDIPSKRTTDETAVKEEEEEEEEEDRRHQRQASDRRRLRFACSGLTAVQIATVKEFARARDADYASQFEPGVTHVIVNTTGERNVAKSTLKYLQGIAHRKWIVSYKWIEDCIRGRGLLDEVPYEATTFGCGADSGAGPRRSRLRDGDLFEDFTFLCVEPYRDVSLSQYQDLLRATGATVVDSLEALAAERKGMKGVLFQEGAHDDKKFEHWYRTAKAAPIVIDWIVECIGQYKLIFLPAYTPSLLPLQLCAIGYPRELVEEDEEEYTDTSA